MKVSYVIPNGYNRYGIIEFVLYHKGTYTATQQNSLINEEYQVSILAIAFPVQAAVPVAQAVAGSLATIARPALGFGLLITIAMIFKPLIVGFLRAALLVLQPRVSHEERNSRRTLRGVLMLNRMANELELSQPSLAAEMRLLAGRG